MQLLIRTLEGRTRTADADPAQPIAALHESLGIDRGTDHALAFRSLRLDPSSSLNDYGILPGDTVQLMFRLRGGAKIKRCQFPILPSASSTSQPSTSSPSLPSTALPAQPTPSNDQPPTTSTLDPPTASSTTATATAPPPTQVCGERAVDWTCALCEGRFCKAHRLPETHACANLRIARHDAFESNKAKLLAESLGSSKSLAGF